MGLIDNSQFETSYGNSMTGTYLSLNGQELNIRHETDMQNPTVKTLRFSAYFSRWVNKDARNTGKPPISIEVVNPTITDSTKNGDLYAIAYTALKAVVTNSTDDM